MTTITDTQVQLLAREELTAEQRMEMRRLLDSHFEGITLKQFERDLAEKNWVILLQRDQRLVGFSTLLAYETRFGEKPVSVIYSGDTIVAPEAWGTTALPRAWIEAVNQLRATVPRGDYYWLLLTSGFRTYRFLPVFWRQFYPRFDAATPEEKQGLLNHLAAERFGRQFAATTGLVRFAEPQRLRGELKCVPTGRENDPHVAFFLQRNPACSEGDELVCLTQLTSQNLTAAGRRMVANPIIAPACHAS